MNNTKVNIYKKILQEICEKFNDAEAFVRESIEEECNEKKWSVEELTYLFTNEYGNLLSCLLKSNFYNNRMILASVANFLLRLCLLYMQNLEVKNTILKIKKTKTEIKRELEDSIVNGRKNENADMPDKVNRCITNEDAVKVIQEFEQIIRNKKSDIMWLAYYQGQIFQKFREKETFLSNMVLKFHVSKSTIVFKIALKKLIDDFSKLKDRLIVVPSWFF